MINNYGGLNLIQSIKRVTLEKNVDLELFNKIKKFALKKRETGEVKIFFPKEEYFEDDFRLISPDNNIILSLYYEDEDSYKRLVARLMDGFDELGISYEWGAAYFPQITIVFEESIDSENFHRIIGKKRKKLDYCKVFSVMSSFDSTDIILVNFSMFCQINFFDSVLNEILSEIREVNPDFEVILK